MFVLLWLTLLFTVRKYNAVKAASPGETLKQEAETGLCVMIPCTLNSSSHTTLDNAAWYKCDQNCTGSNIRYDKCCIRIQPGSQSRVSLMKPNSHQRNCSIMINDLRKSDSGLYQLRKVKGFTDGGVLHRVHLTVRDLTQNPTVLVTSLTKGQETKVECTAPGYCSGSDPKITWMWKRHGEEFTPVPGNIVREGKRSSSLTFKLSHAHHGMEVICKVSFTNETTTEKSIILNVTYVKKPKITGKRNVTMGGVLNLTCSVDSLPPSLVTWTKPGSKEILEKNTGSATLLISDVTSSHSGEYVCTAQYLHSTVEEKVNVRVGLFSQILNSSGCKNHSKFLTCTCISEGVPLPTIKWPLLENHTGYSIVITVSNHTVNSTFNLAEKQSYTSVECVSSNKNGDEKEKLVVKTAEPEAEEGVEIKLFRIISRLEMIIAFLVGALLSALVCCLLRTCCRNKQRSLNLAETLEMVTSQEDPLIDDGHVMENGQTIDPGAAEGATAGATAGASDVAAEKAEGDYSNLDFSKIKGKTPEKIETTETEYAEIKKEGLREDAEGKEEEEKEEEKEDVEGVYSNVEDLMEKSEE